MLIVRKKFSTILVLSPKFFTPIEIRLQAMTQLLHIGNRTITETEIIELLGNYQMLPQLCREVLIEQALDPIALTSSEQAIAQGYFILDKEAEI